MSKTNTSNYYWADKEEAAVVAYISANTYEERHQIYNQILKKPFQRMVETILRRYPIHLGNYDIMEVEKCGLSHLVEQMVKYNKDKINKSGKKTRAYSYCQTIVRNYYKDHHRKSYSEKLTNLPYEDYSDSIENTGEYTYEIDSFKFRTQQLIEETVKEMRERIDSDNTLKKNEIIVGEAIINVLNNWDLIFLEETPLGNYQKKVSNSYTKNKILKFLQEQTFLTTKEIRNAMKQYKELYYITKKTLINKEE